MSAKLKFLEEHDPKVKWPMVLRKALDDLRKSEGEEAWRYDQQMSTLSGVPLVYLYKLRETPEFKPHVVETPRTNTARVKNAWFVSAKIAAEMRARLKVSL